MTSRLSFKVLVFIIATIISLFVFVPISSAQNVLFQDNFDDGNPDGWDVINQSGSSTWNIVDGKYGVYVEPGLTNSVPNDSLWDFSKKNISYELDLKGIYGTDKNIIIKFKDLNNFMELHHSEGALNIEKRVNGTQYFIAGAYYPLDNGSVYHFKIELVNNNIKVFINNSLIIDVIDIYPQYDNWKIGLREGTGATSPTEVRYDNLVVTEIALPVTPTPTATPISTPSPIPTINPTPTTIPVFPNLNVPDIKQFNLPWKNHIYDTAFLWSSNPTIDRWGCALTSATMILNYYGRNITPDTLNNWLKSQPDGYIGNGLVNWLAISRYSKITSNSILPSLEYLRLPGNLSVLINELNNNRPSILETPGHFIVSKSQTLNSFGINDPAYSNRNTLEAYGNSFISLGSFIPSHTDLSYLMLTIDPEVNILVKDSSGEIVQGVYFVQNPIIDDLGDSVSGSPIGIFMYPKPEKDNYQIEISGNSPSRFKLNSYIYDEYGNVEKRVISGTTRKGKVEKYNITLKSKPIRHYKKQSLHWFRFWWRMFR